MKTLTLNCMKQENDCSNHDFAAIRVNRQFLEYLFSLRTLLYKSLGKAQVVTKDTSLRYGFKMTWFDGSPHFYALYSLPEDEVAEWDGGLEEKLQGNGVEWLTPAETEQVDKLIPERTECTRIHLCCDGMYWTTIPKHTDLEVTTAELSWSVIEEALAEEVTEDE